MGGFAQVANRPSCFIYLNSSTYIGQFIAPLRGDKRIHLFRLLRLLHLYATMNKIKKR